MPCKYVVYYISIHGNGTKSSMKLWHQIGIGIKQIVKEYNQIYYF
jgi:hypothetical protein